jgi:hypothetical protein
MTRQQWMVNEFRPCINDATNVVAMTHRRHQEITENERKENPLET